MKESAWSDSINLPGFEELKGDVKTDVLVIGGGICGILCARFLHDAGVDYILAEGKRIASGTTKNTTAKITSQHGLIYSKLIKSCGKEKAQMYLNANEKALCEYKRLSEKLDFDFEEKKAYTYSLKNRWILEDEVRAVNELGFSAEYIERLELPFRTVGGVCFPRQAQFNPLKFINGIVNGLNIYENTFIRDITPDTAVSDNCRIKAKKIIITTHFPFINKHGSYFLKLYQHRSYVSAYENTGKLEGMYVDENEKGMSFRTYKNLLFMGGGGHRTGKQGGAWSEIDRRAREYFPGAVLKYQWATQDTISLDDIPYIGKYSAKTPDLYVASGFNKWGMTSSMAAAMILCDVVQGRSNEFAEVFSPQRSMLKGQLFINGLEATVNLLTPSTKRCPHLGCALKWNKAEHTWDCPCHGSRFEENGNLIDNPSTGDVSADKLK